MSRSSRPASPAAPRWGLAPRLAVGVDSSKEDVRRPAHRPRAGLSAPDRRALREDSDEAASASTKLIAILAAVVVALVGCGDDNSADQRTPTAQVEELCKAVDPYKGKDGDKPYPEVIAPILQHAHDQYAHLAEALAKLDDGSLSGLVEQVKAVELRLEVAARAARQGDMEALADAAPDAQKSLDQLSAEFRRAGFNDCIVLGTLP